MARQPTISTPSALSEAAAGLRWKINGLTLPFSGGTTGATVSCIVQGPGVVEDLRMQVVTAGSGATTTTTYQVVTLSKQPAGSATESTLATVRVACGASMTLAKGYPSSSTSQAALEVSAGDVLRLHYSAVTGSTTEGTGLAEVDVYRNFGA